MWVGWAITSFLAAASTGTVLVGVLSSRKARSTAFNLYIAGLMVPDFVFSLSCGLTCALNHAHDGFVSDAMCEWQSVYIVFGFAGSAWMNALPAREVYVLLCKSAHLEKYTPPSTKTVLLQIAAVFSFSLFLATWTLWGVLPHQANAIGGLACLPVEYSVASTLFFWLAFAPAFIGIPTVYTLYVAFRVWRGTLITIRPRVSSAVAPSVFQTRAVRARNRQARALTLYFARIFVVYIGMWLPAVFLIFVLKLHNEWLAWAGGLWSHLQGVVSAGMSLTKPDILVAVLALFGCKRGCCTSESEGELSVARVSGCGELNAHTSFRLRNIWPGMGPWSSKSTSVCSKACTDSVPGSELAPSQTGIVSMRISDLVA